MRHQVLELRQREERAGGRDLEQLQPFDELAHRVLLRAERRRRAQLELEVVHDARGRDRLIGRAARVAGDRDVIGQAIAIRQGEIQPQGGSGRRSECEIHLVLIRVEPIGDVRALRGFHADELAGGA